MFGIFTRIKMHHCLNKLETLWYKCNDCIAGDAAMYFSRSKSSLKTLRALESAQCVSLSYADNSNRPFMICPGEQSSLYVLERSEVWLNRVISFIAGILTTVAAQYIIDFLRSL